MSIHRNSILSLAFILQLDPQDLCTFVFYTSGAAPVDIAIKWLAIGLVSMVAEQKMHFLLCFSSTTWARRTAKPVGEISNSKSWHRARNWEWAGKQNHKAGHGWVWDSDENGSGVWCAGGLSQLRCPGAEEPAQDPAWRISLGARISNGGLCQAQKSWLEWQRALLCRLILGK